MKMFRFFAIASALACLSAAGLAQTRLPDRPEPAFLYFQKDLETQIVKQSVQGTAIFGNFLFSMRNTGICVVTDLKAKKLVSEFNLGSYGVENHANDAFFSTVYYDVSDRFPLLYVSQCKEKPVTEIGRPETDTRGRLLFVERITTDDDGIPVGSELVQVIEYLPKKWNSRLWVFDRKDPSYIYCYGNTTGNAKPDNRIVVQKLRLPGVGPFLVTLTSDDVLDEFYVDEALPKGARGPQNNILQGGVVVDGVLFLPTGVGEAEYPSELFYIDMKKRDANGKPYRYGYYDYTDIIPCEMEDVDVWGDRLICTTNCAGRLRPVYSFYLRDFKTTTNK